MEETELVSAMESAVPNANMALMGQEASALGSPSDEDFLTRDTPLPGKESVLAFPLSLRRLVLGTPRAKSYLLNDRQDG